jgi:hypothetical protein
MIVGITFVLGYLVEALQSGFNRTPDTGDLLRNFIGVGIAICFLLPIRHTIPKMAITLFQIILLIALTLQFYPIAIALIDEHHARQTFPVLSDFQTAGQIHRWTSDNHIAIENDIGRQGNHAMRADLTTNRYSGFSLKHFPANWQHYHKFEFSIYNPSEKAIEITCRIHDKLHLQGLQPYEDRFNATHSFTTGWTTITISLEEIRQAPADRQMDLGQIYSIIFFASDLPHPRTIYIDDVRLY